MNEEYLKLCESCPLLKNWEPREGDRYYLKNDLYVTIEGDKYFLTANKSKALKRGLATFNAGVNYVCSSFGHYDTFAGSMDGSVELRRNSFFLPYQHQFEDKLEKWYPSLFYLYEGFFKFAFNPDSSPIKFYDSDTLWLLFYCQENLLKWDFEKEEWRKKDD